MSPAVLVFDASNWNTPQTISITAQHDQIVEGTENHNILVSPATSSDVAFRSLPQQSLSVDVLDDDTPDFQISQTDDTTQVQELAGADAISIVLMSQPQSDVVLSVTSATPAILNASDDNLVFTSSDWNVPQTIHVNAVDNVVVDGTRLTDVVVTVDRATSDAHFGVVAAQTVPITVLDNDVAEFSVVPAFAFEDAGSIPLTIATTNPIDVDVDVAVALISNTASEVDFNSQSQSVSFPAGTTEQQILVPLVDDAVVELDETFLISLTATTGVVNDDRSFHDGDTGIATILNDDVARFSINDVQQVEADSGQTEITFTVSLDSDVDAPVSVTATSFDGTATVADGDYLPLSPTRLDFSGQKDESRAVSVQIVGDGVTERNESFGVRLTGPEAFGRSVIIGNPDGVATIVNDDETLISIDDATIVEGNDGFTELRFPVTLDGEIDTTVSVDFVTVSGSAIVSNDLINAAGRIDFEASGASVQTREVVVQITGDNQVELDETFTVQLSQLTADGRNVVFGDSTGVGTIQNDDSATISLQDVSMVEGDSGLTAFRFDVVSDLGIDVPVSIHYSTIDDIAVSPVDYSPRTGTLTFPASLAGQTLSVTVLVNGDFQEEADESFFLLTSIADSKNRDVAIVRPQATGTILDDDSPPPSAPLDFDGSGQADAATDGILALRYLFGFRGNTLTADAVSTTATRTDSEEIESVIAASEAMLDVDGNGIQDAATDGILFLRYLFGFRGSALSDGAIGAGAIRTSGAEVAEYLDLYQSPAGAPTTSSFPPSSSSEATLINVAPARSSTDIRTDFVDQRRIELFAESSPPAVIVLDESQNDDVPAIDTEFQSSVEWLSLI